MKETLLIIDNTVDPRKLKRLIHSAQLPSLDLFSLCEDTFAVEALKKEKEFSYISFLDSAAAINDEAAVLRQKISGWSKDIGEHMIGGRKIKEILLLPGTSMSAWWLSLVSEKNTAKTDCFLKVIQVRAIKRLLENKHYDSVLLSISDVRLSNSLVFLLKERKIRFKKTSFLPIFSDRKKIRKVILEKSGSTLYMPLGIVFWIKFWLRHLASKLYLGNAAKRAPVPGSLLWISYFPFVDQSAAKKGKFINLYCTALQDKIREQSLPLAWLLMPLSLNGSRYADSLRLARRFVIKGEKLFLVEEFLTLGDWLASFKFWLKQIKLSRSVLKGINRSCLSAVPIGKECENLVRELWRRSFLDTPVLEAILYYHIFKKAFVSFPKISACLYFCEMLAWEKSLNAAKNDSGAKCRSIGFQHANVPKNLFSYFYDQEETRSEGGPFSLPLPDILACNGRLTSSLLKDCGFPNILEVEAARHAYLEKYLGLPLARQNSKPRLLVAGSINEIETGSLASMVYSTFPKPEAIEIIFKAHPCVPFEPIFKRHDIDLSKTGYLITREQISKCLIGSDIVVVSSSSVALEAAACGKPVIVPIFSNSLTYNQLVDFGADCHIVSSAFELAAAVRELSGSQRESAAQKNRQIVKQYWNIDSSLRKWESLFESIK